MIHSFKDRRLEKFFRNGKTTAGIPSEIINAILCRLETLDNVRVSGSYYPTACVMNA